MDLHANAIFDIHKYKFTKVYNSKIHSVVKTSTEIIFLTRKMYNTIYLNGAMSLLEYCYEMGVSLHKIISFRNHNIYTKSATQNLLRTEQHFFINYRAPSLHDKFNFKQFKMARSEDSTRVRPKTSLRSPFYENIKALKHMNNGINEKKILRFPPDINVFVSKSACKRHFMTRDSKGESSQF